MSEPRILVLSASVGAGHLRAAQAVEQALRQRLPGATVRNQDVLELTNPVFRRVYGRGYLDLVNRAPHVLGYFYDYMDRPRSEKGHRDRLRLAMEKLNVAPFIQFLSAEPWDLVINTHFLPAEIVAHLRRQGELSLPQATATTDFETHRLWVNEPCERYFTATEEGARYLEHWGIDPRRVSVTGIPIDPVFTRPKDRAECRATLDMAADRPLLLLLCGGFGVGPLESFFRQLLELAPPAQVVAITGRNAELRHTLSAIEAPERHRVRVLGFTTEIDAWMAAADLVISKPGGLTTSEALARGLPMVIINPIPGQESRNSDYLLEHGAAIKVNQACLLAYKVEELLRAPDRLASLRAAAARLGRPDAAFRVVEESLDLIGARAGKV